MKIKHREYENIDYIEYIDMYIYLLITRKDDQKTFLKIKSKLKNVHLDIFEKIIFYSALIEFASLANDKLSYNPENYDKKLELLKSKEEAEKMLTNYLLSIDRLVFLEAISEITYWMAKIEGARQIKIHEEFLSSWALWDKYLENKNKYKRKGQRIKEKLRIILGDQVDNIEQIYSDFIDEIGRFKEGKKHITIDVDQEIDTKSAEPNQLLFIPEIRSDERNFRLINENTKCVFLNNKEYTLNDYYEIIKNEIDKNWLKSRDLLKQIISIYLIKRCQSGDNDAYNKLFTLYKDKAKNVALSYIKKRGNTIDGHEVDGREATILTVLLKGDDPSYLYKMLEHNRSDKKGIDVLNKKPYVALQESYQQMFMMVNNQYDYLCKQLYDLEKNTKDFRNRSKKAKKVETRRNYFENIFSLSQYSLLWFETTPTLFELFTPFHFLKISQNYNKYLFRPAPNRNLTTWLFGDKDKEFKGMIWISLSNLFDKRTHNTNESFDEAEYFKDESGIYRKASQKHENN